MTDSSATPAPTPAPAFRNSSENPNHRPPKPREAPAGSTSRGPWKPRKPFGAPRPASSGHGYPPRAPHAGGHSAGPRKFGGSSGGSGGGRGRGRRDEVKMVNHVPTRAGKFGEAGIPPLAPRTVRIIPLGGVEEIGRNMTAIEYEGDILVVDCGLSFPEGDTPGVDYILPNTGYLEDNKDRIVGMVITHGHLDHIGGIPYVIEAIGNPVIYTRKLTAAMVKRRHEEFPHLPALQIRDVESNIGIRMGKLDVAFFGVTHTIPDSMGVIIKTGVGDVVLTGDIKLVHDNGVVDEKEVKEFSVFAKNRPLVLMMDSTNCETPGWSIDERRVYQSLENIISDKTKNRIFIGMFASHLERIIRIIQIAEKYGRYVAVDGRSMKANVAIATELGLVTPKQGTVIGVEDIENYAPNKVIVLVTGAQGDEYASLMRMANKSHKYIKLRLDDTIVLSSSVIPGNERSVQRLKDLLSRQGAYIVTYQSSDVHASGHGYREEYRWIHEQVRPKFFIPQHGYHYKLRNHADLMRESIGIPRENIVIPDNSSIIEIQEEGSKIVKLDMKAPANTRVVEGHTVSDLQTTVMRDRKDLSTEGIFVIVTTLDSKTGRLIKSPDIISRGFVYMRESQDLLSQARLIVKKHAERVSQRGYPFDVEAIKDEVSEAVSTFLFQSTNKKPIVIPVVVSV
jgi:ribonuclease J